MRYRSEIDGLRAVAVLPVILFHAGFDIASGGFVGVDVFFVISGYLITSIIHAEIRRGEFSIVTFYERRARRILPALFVVMAACAPFAYLWMFPAELKDFAQSVGAVILFSSNILFWLESGYFESAAELKPLLHTWSLSVEEQFYVLFPLLLLAARRFFWRHLFGVLGLIALASLALSDWATATWPDAAFYMLPTRAWELAVGALIAITLADRGQTPLPFAGPGAALGLGLIVVAAATFDAGMPFPGFWALVPVLGTALVIVFAGPATLTGRLLSMRPMVALGLISYSAYLWHQPLFAFARIHLPEGVSAPVYAALSLLTLVLAHATWRFVEQPARTRTLLTRRRLFQGAVACSMVFAVGAGVTAVGQGFPNRLDPMVSRILSAGTDISPHRARCHASPTNPIMPATACRYGDGAGEPVVLWGDSHGVELAWQLSRSLRPSGRPVVHLTHTACPPAVGVYRHSSEDSCARFSEAVLEFLLSLPRGATVVMIARWSNTLEQQPFDNGEGGREATSERGPRLKIVGTGPAVARDAEWGERLGAVFRRSIDVLVDRGHRVALVYPVPEVGWNVPSVLARQALLRGGRSAPLTTSHDVYAVRTRSTVAQFAEIEDRPNLLRVFPDGVFCDTVPGGRCLTEADGRPLYFDDDHLSNHGASILADHIVEQLTARNWLTAGSAARTEAPRQVMTQPPSR